LIVLEVILSFGNFLNCNSSRGGAWGYRMDSLLRLGEIKSRTDPEKTLLYFIIEFLQREHPHAIDFYHDFKFIDKAKDIQQITSLLSDVQSLDNGIKNTEEFCSNPAAQCGKFLNSVQDFIPIAKQKVQILRELYKTANENFLELLIYFGEPKTTPVGNFFGTLHSFIVSFEKTKFSIAKRDTVLKGAKNTNAGMHSVPSQGTLDRLIAGLKSGEAFVEKTSET